MAEINLTQAEADALIAREKRRIDDERWNYPGLGGSISIPLVSLDKREKFLLDISRGKIDLLKGSYQNRSRQVIVLVRVDFGGQPHRNPDDKEIPSPHLHIYREGYGDKWATLIPADRFSNISDSWQTLEDFMIFCNIIEPPLIDRGLF
ncbi:MAG: hypothetical protein HY891_04580 [Deltaproteobacteria bacterium]|nr:hypothetical protein [Deltaproteobacteria bacterium]